MKWFSKLKPRKTDVPTPWTDPSFGRSYLVSIHRDGRVNIFTFVRPNGETYIVETMGLLGDNVAEWKEMLL